MPMDLPVRRPLRTLSDLDAIRLAPVPRIDAPGTLILREVAPPSGLLLQGMLYLAVAVTAVVLGASIAAMAILGAVTGQQPLPAWAVGVVGVVSIVAFGLAWLPFVLMARHKRGELRRIVRDGALV